MTVYATELCDPKDALVGWGMKVVMDGFARAGRPCESVLLGAGTRPAARPRVWLVSLGYAGSAHRIREFFEDLAGEPMDKRLRDGRTTYILGGHAIVNVEPFCDIFDAVFVGEADDQTEAIARCDGDLDKLAEVPGIALDEGEVWFQRASSLKWRGLYEASFDEEDDDRKTGRTTYLETARGCTAACRFCELGWLYGYTERTKEETMAIMASAPDPSKVVLSAPDTDGVSWLSDAISQGEYRPRWRSTRVLPYLQAHPSAPDGKRGRIRFGVEGVTERLRRQISIRKAMTDVQIEQAVNRAIAEGYRTMRMFLIGGIPGERHEDRRHLSELVAIYERAKGLRHWKAADIKITGLSPQPYTPWQRFGVARSLDALRDYRRIVGVYQKIRPQFRTVMVDAQDTEADVVKRMGRGELIPYLMARPRGENPESAQRRWEAVRKWAMAAGIDYDGRVLADIPFDAQLPWHRTRHKYEKAVANVEVKAWREAGELVLPSATQP
jgi:hypothetical protein